MKYITPEIEINIIQTEDIMAVSENAVQNGVSMSGSDGVNDAVNVGGTGNGGLGVDVGADFFA